VFGWNLDDVNLLTLKEYKKVVGYINKKFREKKKKR